MDPFSRSTGSDHRDSNATFTCHSFDLVQAVGGKREQKFIVIPSSQNHLLQGRVVIQGCLTPGGERNPHPVEIDGNM